MEVLQAKNLRKIYGSGNNAVHALDGVDLSVQKGEFVAIVGTSGSGKSTLLHMMGGLDTPTSGDVIISGKKLSNKSEEQMAIFRRRHIGFVFQNYNLIPILNVYENIVLPVQLDGRRVDKDLLEQIVCALGLQDKLHNLPNNLSGGQQQRVSIARAILKNAPILILDEASAYADAENEHEMQIALQSLIKNKTVIMIAHRLTTICNANQILVVDSGQIEEHGTHDELLKKHGLYAAMWDAGVNSATWTIRTGKEAVTE